MMIRRIQDRSKGKVPNLVGRLYVSTSFCGGVLPGPGVTEAADFLRNL